MTREHVHGRLLRDVVPEQYRLLVDELVRAEDFFENLEVMPDAQEVLLKLSHSHDVFITTAAMEVPESFNSKYRWLLRHFPYLSPMNFVFCGDKHIVAADYLIDDNVRHFAKFKGEGILFDAPHNRNVMGYRRVHNWKEVEAFFAPTLAHACV
jgi:5'-nucleotidase